MDDSLWLDFSIAPEPQYVTIQRRLRLLVVAAEDGKSNPPPASSYTVSETLLLRMVELNFVKGLCAQIVGLEIPKNVADEVRKDIVFRLHAIKHKLIDRSHQALIDGTIVWLNTHYPT